MLSDDMAAEDVLSEGAASVTRTAVVSTAAVDNLATVVAMGAALVSDLAVVTEVFTEVVETGFAVDTEISVVRSGVTCFVTRGVDVEVAAGDCGVVKTTGAVVCSLPI